MNLREGADIIIRDAEERFLSEGDETLLKMLIWPTDEQF